MTPIRSPRASTSFSSVETEDDGPPLRRCSSKSECTNSMADTSRPPRRLGGHDQSGTPAHLPGQIGALLIPTRELLQEDVTAGSPDPEVVDEGGALPVDLLCSQ